MPEWLTFEVHCDSGAVHKVEVHEKTSVGDLKDTLYLSYDAPEPKRQQLYYKGRQLSNDEELGSFMQAGNAVIQLKQN